jgi:hypothetical protein
VKIRFGTGINVGYSNILEILIDFDTMLRSIIPLTSQGFEILRNFYDSWYFFIIFNYVSIQHRDREKNINAYFETIVRKDKDTNNKSPYILLRLQHLLT